MYQLMATARCSLFIYPVSVITTITFVKTVILMELRLHDGLQV